MKWFLLFAIVFLTSCSEDPDRMHVEAVNKQLTSKPWSLTSQRERISSLTTGAVLHEADSSLVGQITFHPAGLAVKATPREERTLIWRLPHPDTLLLGTEKYFIATRTSQQLALYQEQLDWTAGKRRESWTIYSN